MKTSDILHLIDDREFLDMIYRFSYHRCNTSHEAEDLCSDIILAVIAAVRKQPQIESPYAFIWTVARRVYADHCDKRRKEAQTVSIEGCELLLCAGSDAIDEFIEETVADEQLKRIFSEIAFLSKAYRDVMVMYYIDGRRVSEIADVLGISQTTVKQRLFSARNTVRKEVETMEKRNLSLKPKRMLFFGTGAPVGNDPYCVAERTLSQNLIYLCKDKPKTAKELSQELCVPMPFIEEELEIQCHGQNGSYGFLRRLENGKYTTNVHLVDYAELDEANKVYVRHFPMICQKLKDSLQTYGDRILHFPYLSEQSDMRFVLWSFIHRMVWGLQARICGVLKERYFADIEVLERPFTCVAIAHDQSDDVNICFCGCDSISANAVEGYRSIHMRNLYTDTLDARFRCGHNISLDPQIRMLLRSIGGLSVNTLSEEEKEIAAKAIESGYLRKVGDMLEPRIVAIHRKDEPAFNELVQALGSNMDDLVDAIAKELAIFIKAHVPAHLMNEYPIYVQLIAAVQMPGTVIDACVAEGLLSVPQGSLAPEGVMLIVEK